MLQGPIAIFIRFDCDILSSVHLNAQIKPSPGSGTRLRWLVASARIPINRKLKV